uniref:ZM domain-containing protein n=1 Tax=Rhabditophanes sp. KR3021 TaxID=114890 RepID=A0AC35UHR1_9BILA
MDRLDDYIQSKLAGTYVNSDTSVSYVPYERYADHTSRHSYNNRNSLIVLNSLTPPSMSTFVQQPNMKPSEASYTPINSNPNFNNQVGYQDPDGLNTVNINFPNPIHSSTPNRLRVSKFKDVFDDSL